MFGREIVFTSFQHVQLTYTLKPEHLQKCFSNETIPNLNLCNSTTNVLVYAECVDILEDLLLRIGYNHGEALNALQSPSWPICEQKNSGITIIHTWWSGPLQKEMIALPMSYVVTQNRQTSKFILWLEEIPQDLSILSPVLPYIEIRQLNKTVEMMEAGIWDWYKNQGKDLLSSPVPTSDVIRTVLLHNYGGIWLDTDCIFLRDMSPLLLLPFDWAPRLGANFKFNIHVLSLR